MNTITTITETTYPLIELSDWIEFGGKVVKSIKDKDIYKGYIPVSVMITKLKKEMGWNFYVSKLMNKGVVISSLAEDKRLKKNLSYDSKRRYSYSDKRHVKWNFDIHKYFNDSFIIKSTSNKYCYISPKSDNSQSFLMFYDEILIDEKEYDNIKK